MRRVILFFSAIAAMLTINGCDGSYASGYDDGYYDGATKDLVTLYLVDEYGYGVGNIPYECIDAYGEIVYRDRTYANGEFSFEIGDRCTFDLYGFAGSTRDPLYIVDIDGFGKDDIPFYCDNGNAFSESVTDFDGFFAYPVDAYCKFYF